MTRVFKIICFCNRKGSQLVPKGGKFECLRSWHREACAQEASAWIFMSACCVECRLACQSAVLTSMDLVQSDHAQRIVLCKRLRADAKLHCLLARFVGLLRCSDLRAHPDSCYKLVAESWQCSQKYVRTRNLKVPNLVVEYINWTFYDTTPIRFVLNSAVV